MTVPIIIDIIIVIGGEYRPWEEINHIRGHWANDLRSIDSSQLQLTSLWH